MGVVQKIAFLGTSAGKPSKNRNASSLALLLDGSTWLFDVAEGTQRQALLSSSIRLGSVNKIFITHMHGDHCLGLVPMLLTMGETINPAKSLESQALDIYGPQGIRELIRTTFRLVAARETRPFRIHELLHADEPSTLRSLAPALSELASGSSDIRPDHEGYFQVFNEGDYTVKAGPIKHTIPCLGYVVEEAASRRSFGQHERDMLQANSTALQAQGINPMSLLGKLQRGSQPIPLPDGSTLEPPPFSRPGRKVVILGDTYDATKLLPLAQGADLVVHESTNAFLPQLDPETDPAATFESVRERAASRGHSVPEVAAHFVREANASRLVINHLSPRYPSPPDTSDTSTEASKQRNILSGICEAARKSWGERAGEVTLAHDMLTLEIPRRPDDSTG